MGCEGASEVGFGGCSSANVSFSVFGEAATVAAWFCRTGGVDCWKKAPPSRAGPLGSGVVLKGDACSDMGLVWPRSLAMLPPWWRLAGSLPHVGLQAFWVSWQAAVGRLDGSRFVRIVPHIDPSIRPEIFMSCHPALCRPCHRRLILRQVGWRSWLCCWAKGGRIDRVKVFVEAGDCPRGFWGRS